MVPQNFEKLKKELIELKINNQEAVLKGTIDIIFEKSIREPQYCPMYTQLCQSLSTLELTEITGSSAKTFLSILLTRCQKIFDVDSYELSNGIYLFIYLLFQIHPKGLWYL